MSAGQVLTAAQMRAAEQALFDNGVSVSDLMEVAAGGAAEWILRVAAGRSVTILCGPGNNGGDGYVIARRLRAAGNAVTLVAPVEPKTDAAREARRGWNGPVVTAAGDGAGDIFVDSLFGSGLAARWWPNTPCCCAIWRRGTATGLRWICPRASPAIAARRSTSACPSMI